MEKTLLRKSLIAYNEWGDGAGKRSAQIHSILQQRGYTVNTIDNTPRKNRIISFLTGIKFIVANRFQLKLDSYFLRKVLNIGRSYEQLSANFRNHRGEKIVLWDYNIFGENFLLPYVARDFKFKVIALPHNLESLVSGQASTNTGKISPDWLIEEINHLKKCHAVFTISREEDWLLKLYGVRSHYLPYFPTDAVYENLIEIRNKRLTQNFFSDYLMLGSYANPPTANGMQELLINADKIKSDETIFIGGYETEKIKLKISLPFKLLGTLDKKTLNEMMTKCRAIIINQAVSSGALTKIIEFLIAGIPVISNFDALRSYYNTHGIHSYNSPEELNEFLSVKNFEMPSLINESSRFKNNFIKTLIELNG